MIKIFLLYIFYLNLHSSKKSDKINQLKLDNFENIQKGCLYNCSKKFDSTSNQCESYYIRFLFKNNELINKDVKKNNKFFLECKTNKNFLKKAKKFCQIKNCDDINYQLIQLIN